MSEKWIKWEPINGLSNKYNINLLSDAVGGFRIIFSEVKDEQKKICVVFENSVRVYRVTNKTLWLKSGMNTLHAEPDWTFFKVTDSNYALWIRDESYKIFPEEWFMHFAFIGSNAVIDILAGYEPTVEFTE